MDTHYQDERAGPVRPAGGSWQGPARPTKRTRSYLQNRFIHSCLNQIADQLAWPKDTGELHDLEWWKRRCTLQWLIDNDQPVQVITALDGSERFGLLLPHTSDLTTAECADLSEWILAFGAEHGVTFREPAPKGER